MIIFIFLFCSLRIQYACIPLSHLKISLLPVLIVISNFGVIIVITPLDHVKLDDSKFTDGNCRVSFKFNYLTLDSNNKQSLNRVS